MLDINNMGKGSKRATKKNAKISEQMERLAVPKAETNENEHNDASSDSQSAEPGKKAVKRGRKNAEPTQYFYDSQKKIAEWKKNL